MAAVMERGRSGPEPEWTRGQVLTAMRLWAAMYGESPTTGDWHPSLARQRGEAWRAERYEARGHWPNHQQVGRLFPEGWNAALVAAGLPPNRPGRRPAGYRPLMTPLIPAANGRRPGELECAVEATAGALESVAALEAKITRLAADRRRLHDDLERERTEHQDAVGRLAACARDRGLLEAQLETVRRQPRTDSELRTALSAARRRIMELEREAREVAARPRAPTLSTAQLQRLDAGRRAEAGPQVLAAALAELARVRRRGAGNPALLGRALLAVASAAVSWRARLTA